MSGGRDGLGGGELLQGLLEAVVALVEENQVHLARVASFRQSQPDARCGDRDERSSSLSEDGVSEGRVHCGDQKCFRRGMEGIEKSSRGLAHVIFTSLQAKPRQSFRGVSLSNSSHPAQFVARS